MSGKVVSDTTWLCYQRLNWDSFALQRIFHGNVSRDRRMRTQAIAVWDLAFTILGNKDTAAIFPRRNLPKARRTTAVDLLAAGYRMRSVGMQWSEEEVLAFFRACAQFRRAPEHKGNYATVYDWIAYSILKGSRRHKRSVSSQSKCSTQRSANAH